MQFFLTKVAICSITMSVIAFCFIIISPVLSKKYSPKWLYYTWLVIVIGFIIPFRPDFDFAFFEVNTSIAQLEVTLPLEDNNILSATGGKIMGTPAITIFQIIGLIWLVGIVFVIGYHAVHHYRFMKMVNRWSEIVSDKETIIVLNELMKDMGIENKAKLQISPLISGPMMVGFFTPTIMLPTTDFSKDELLFILKHELVHFKRKDLWYKSLVLFATVIHWFNPIVYLMSNAISMQCELSCDTEVVNQASIHTRQQYSETIIGVIRQQSILKTSLSTNFYGGKEVMKKRIFSIMDTTKKKAGMAIVCGVIVITMSTGVAFAAQNKSASFTEIDDLQLNKIKSTYHKFYIRMDIVDEILQRSFDGGKTWTPVKFDDPVIYYTYDEFKAYMEHTQILNEDALKQGIIKQEDVDSSNEYFKNELEKINNGEKINKECELRNNTHSVKSPLGKYLFIYH